MEFNLMLLLSYYGYEFMPPPIACRSILAPIAVRKVTLLYSAGKRLHLHVCISIIYL